jgi:hypothetical protein
MPSEFTYYWCAECGWDTIRSSSTISSPCPLCAGDNGRDGDMRQRPATEDDGAVEGRDDRKSAENSNAE